jgi:hypothetical protein
MLIAVFIALVLFAHTPAPKAPVTPIAPTATLAADRKVFMLEVVKCPEATACVMNVVGEKGLLGRQVAVAIGSYQAPSAHYYSCRLEKYRGQRAAVFLEETLRSADFVFLMNAHKKKGSPYLTGNLIVDGRDITVLMFEMQIAVPRGIKVDWCEKVSRGFEV